MKLIILDVLKTLLAKLPVINPANEVGVEESVDITPVAGAVP
jgi:hypothetical protein